MVASSLCVMTRCTLMPGTFHKYVEIGCVSFASWNHGALPRETARSYHCARLQVPSVALWAGLLRVCAFVEACTFCLAASVPLQGKLISSRR
eukprot:6479138-Amphidinium_carterae.3